MNVADEFKQRVEAYLEATGMKPTVFGMRALNSPNFISRLRAGADIKLDTVDRVYRWMAENPPEAQEAEKCAS